MPEQPTTPDLLELGRRANEATNRLDFGASVSIFAADAVWDLSLAGLGTHYLLYHRGTHIRIELTVRATASSGGSSQETLAETLPMWTLPGLR